MVPVEGGAEELMSEQQWPSSSVSFLSLTRDMLPSDGRGLRPVARLVSAEDMACFAELGSVVGFSKASGGFRNWLLEEVSTAPVSAPVG
jgi:hypothetical protein